MKQPFIPFIQISIDCYQSQKILEPTCLPGLWTAEAAFERALQIYRTSEGALGGFAAGPNLDFPTYPIEQFIERTQATVRTEEGLDVLGRYMVMEDIILAFPASYYESRDAHYAVMFHELIHWSGANHRLARVSLLHYANHNTEEEFVAELGSLTLLVGFGITNPTILGAVASTAKKFAEQISGVAHHELEALRAVRYLLGD